MLRDLWRKRETRDSNATDNAVERILDAAIGNTANIKATAALETAANMIGRALALARVDGYQVDPHMLLDIGRTLIRKGEYAAWVFNGRLQRADIIQVTGTSSRENWEYTLNIKAPNGVVERRVANADCVHFRYAVNNGETWKGVAPVDIANITANLYSNLQRTLGDEAGTPMGFLLPVPTRDGGSSAVDLFRATLADLRGRIATVESTQSLATTSGIARERDWHTVRLGANPPQSVVDLLEQTRMEIMGLCGIPRALLSAADGSGQREAWRQFLFGTIAPLGAIIQAELRAKLSSTITISFDELRASDLTGRARAFQSLVGGGMDITQAATLSGLLEQD